MPLRLKIATYQRELIMAGIKYKKSTLSKQGRQVITAVETFKKENGLVQDINREEVVKKINKAINLSGENFI
jgi:hypothetical protein